MSICGCLQANTGSSLRPKFNVTIRPPREEHRCGEFRLREVKVGYGRGRCVPFDVLEPRNGS
jgi:hypothetical protein